MHATSFSRRALPIRVSGVEDLCRIDLPSGARFGRRRARGVAHVTPAELTRIGRDSAKGDLCSTAREQVPVISGVSIRQRSPDGPSPHRGGERRYGSLPIRVARRGRPICGRRPAGVLGQLESAELGHGASRRVAVGAARRGHAGGPPRAEGARHLSQLESAESHASARRGGRERSLPIRVAWRSGPIHRAAPAAACARSHGVQLAKRRLARGRLCSSERGARALATDLCRFESAARGGRLYEARVHRTRYGRLESAEMHASATSARPEVYCALR